MRVGPTIATACLGVVAAAGLLWAGDLVATNSNGLPDLQGNYEGTLKLKLRDQTGAESGKDRQKLDLLVQIDQRAGSTVTAFVTVGDGGDGGDGGGGRSAHDANATFTMTGAVGGGSFYLCTIPGEKPEMLLAGTAKDKGNGKIKLKATGVYVFPSTGRSATVAGTASIKLNRTIEIQLKR